MTTNLKILNEDDLVKVINKELEVPIYPQFIGQEEWCVNKLLKQRKFKFNTDLNGIVIRYDHMEFLSETGRIIDDMPLIFWKIRADFKIINVQNNQIIKCFINRIGSKYIGCSIFNCIDVTIKFDETIENEIENFICSNYKIGNEIIFKTKSFIPSKKYIEGIIDEEIFKYLKKNCGNPI